MNYQDTDDRVDYENELKNDSDLTSNNDLNDQIVIDLNP